MENLCKSCTGRIVMCAFSNGKCEICNSEVFCVNTPVDKLCDDCSIENNKCQHCGNELER